MATPRSSCTVCGQLTARYCSYCLLRFYCSRQCQASHWSSHKLECVQSHIETITNCFRDHGIYGCSLLASIMLMERLQRDGIAASVKYGYFLFDGGKAAGRHVWVENTGGAKFDVGYAITKKTWSHVSLFTQVKPDLVYQLPRHAVRIDLDTPEERREAEELESAICKVRFGTPTVEYLSAAPEIYRKIYNELCPSG